MQDLSLHLLDIAQNSIRAQAHHLTICLKEDVHEDWLYLSIEDDGCGMTQDFVDQVTNPFVTTRTLRRVGLGLPFLRQNCEACEGTLSIKSEVGKGTLVEAIMKYHHIDRVPLGDLASSIVTLIQGAPEVCLTYTHYYNDKHFTFSTEEIKDILGDVPIQDLEIINWLKQYIQLHIIELQQKESASN